MELIIWSKNVLMFLGHYLCIDIFGILCWKGWLRTHNSAWQGPEVLTFEKVSQYGGGGGRVAKKIYCHSFRFADIDLAEKTHELQQILKLHKSHVSPKCFLFCPFQPVLQMYFQYVSMIYMKFTEKNAILFIILTWKAHNLA